MSQKVSQSRVTYPFQPSFGRLVHCYEIERCDRLIAKLLLDAAAGLEEFHPILVNQEQGTRFYLARSR